MSAVATDRDVSVAIDRLTTRAYTIPTETPESDGTFSWDSTTLVIVEIFAADQTGIGMSYADPATAEFIRRHLFKVAAGKNAGDIPFLWQEMKKAVRNLGRPGVASMAIAAVDNALWDLKARLLGISLVDLLGKARTDVPIYGSGGFTNYSQTKLEKHLRWFSDQGISRMKIKVGQHPEQDVARVKLTREVLGPQAEIFVDANGGYSRKQALKFAEQFADLGVVWFEEPVSSDDLEGLRLVRDRAPAGMDITAGEYGYDSFYFRRMLEAAAVDVLQADATRCEGISGFQQAAALCVAHNIPLSAHTSPSQHVAVAASVPQLRHVEYFFDHVRIEHLYLDGAADARGNTILLNTSVLGNGLAVKHPDLEEFKLFEAHS